MLGSVVVVIVGEYDVIELYVCVDEGVVVVFQVVGCVFYGGVVYMCWGEIGNVQVSQYVFVQWQVRGMFVIEEWQYYQVFCFWWCCVKMCVIVVVVEIEGGGYVFGGYGVVYGVDQWQLVFCG